MLGLQWAWGRIGPACTACEQDLALVHAKEEGIKMIKEEQEAPLTQVWKCMQRATQQGRMLLGQGPMPVGRLRGIGAAPCYTGA